MPLVLDGTNGVSGVDGTASNPAIEGTDSNTGIFYPAADTVAIGTGGTEALRVTSAQNVGIGTSSPATRLAINGISALGTGFASADTSNARPAYVRSSDNNSLISFQSSSTTGDGFMVGMAGAEPRLQVTNNLPLIFLTNNTERMRIDSSGNVGIGTSSPTNKLHVAGNILATGETYTDAGVTAALTNGSSADILTTSTYEVYLISLRGNVNTATYAHAIVYVNGAGALTITTLGSNGMSVTSSGTNKITATNQTAATTQSIWWSAFKLKRLT